MMLQLIVVNGPNLPNRKRHRHRGMIGISPEITGYADLRLLGATRVAQTFRYTRHGAREHCSISAVPSTGGSGESARGRYQLSNRIRAPGADRWAACRRSVAAGVTMRAFRQPENIA